MKRFLMALCALGALAIITTAQNAQLPSALASLVDAERTFARTSVEKGIRASFIEFFADDGLHFRPQPVVIKKDFTSRPAPAGPQPFTLNWEPIYADISQAGDLGYTTGPATKTDNPPANKPPTYAYYFSVWKKQTDGSWKVLLDFGTGTPESVDVTKDIAFQAAPLCNWKVENAKRDPAAERLELLELEKELSNVSINRGTVAAYRDYLMDSSRLHRNGLVPVVGKDGILQFLTGKKVKAVSFEPLDAGVSSSSDLAYTYGKYKQLEKPSVKGYFLRVWKRDGQGNWRIVADIASPLPQGL